MVRRIEDQPEPVAMLLVEYGSENFSVFPLDEPVCLIGRYPDAHIFLDSRFVSRRHAYIRQVHGRFEIEDLGSRNGTRVNGNRISATRHVLNPGDQIQIGDKSISLRFERAGSTISLRPNEPGTTEDIVVDADAREVWLYGEHLQPPLSRKEFDILNLLYQQRGKACSRDQLAAHGWPERQPGDTDDQSIGVYIRRLRLRFEPTPSDPQFIVTVPGFGYRLNA